MLQGGRGKFPRHGGRPTHSMNIACDGKIAILAHVRAKKRLIATFGNSEFELRPSESATYRFSNRNKTACLRISAPLGGGEQS